MEESGFERDLYEIFVEPYIHLCKAKSKKVYYPVFLYSRIIPIDSQGYIYGWHTNYTNYTNYIVGELTDVSVAIDAIHIQARPKFAYEIHKSSLIVIGSKQVDTQESTSNPIDKAAGKTQKKGKKTKALAESIKKAEANAKSFTLCLGNKSLCPVKHIQTCFHTKTQEEFNALMIDLEDLGYSWYLSYVKPTEDISAWEKFKKKTCVTFDSSKFLDCVPCKTAVSNDYTIVEYSSLGQGEYKYV